MSEIKTKVTAETAEATSKINKFVGTLKGIGTAAKGIGAGVTMALGPIAAITAALGGVMAVANGFKDAIDFGGDLEDVSTKTGIAIDSLVILQDAFEKAGLGAESVGKAVLSLSNKLESPSKATEEALNKLGISLEDIQKMSAEDRFKAIGDAIANLSSTTEKASVASKLFGKSLGPDLLVLFAGGSQAIKDAETNVGGLADTMQKNASAFAKIGDAIDSVSIKARQFFAAAIGQNTDRLLAIADKFLSMDFTNVGNVFGQMIDFVANINDVLVESISKGNFFATLKEGWDYVLLSIKPTMISIMESAGVVFSDILTAVYNNTFGQVTGVPKAKTTVTKEQETLQKIKDLQDYLSKYKPEHTDPISKRDIENTKKKIKDAEKELSDIKKGSYSYTQEELSKLKELTKKFGKESRLGIHGPNMLMELPGPLNESERGIINKFFKTKPYGPELPNGVVMLPPILGPETPTSSQQEAMNAFAEGVKKQKSSLFSELFSGGRENITTSLQRIGGASALTGARSALDEAKETNNILRQIKELLSSNKKPNNTTTASFA